MKAFFISILFFCVSCNAFAQFGINFPTEYVVFVKDDNTTSITVNYEWLDDVLRQIDEGTTVTVDQGWWRFANQVLEVTSGTQGVIRHPEATGTLRLDSITELNFNPLYMQSNNVGWSVYGDDGTDMFWGNGTSNTLVRWRFSGGTLLDLDMDYGGQTTNLSVDNITADGDITALDDLIAGDDVEVGDVLRVVDDIYTTGSVSIGSDDAPLAAVHVRDKILSEMGVILESNNSAVDSFVQLMGHLDIASGGVKIWHDSDIRNTYFNNVYGINDDDFIFQVGGVKAFGIGDTEVSSAASINLDSGLAYKINDGTVLDATTLGSGVVNSSLTGVGTISSGVWQGTVIDQAYLDVNVVLDDGTRTITGDQNITGSLGVDNLSFDGNTISSTDVNGPLVFDPNGTGEIGFNANTVTTGSATITGSVGIGTGSPKGNLQILGGSRAQYNMTEDAGGNFGVNVIAPDNIQYGFDVEFDGAAANATDGSYGRLIKNTDRLYFEGATGQTPGSAISGGADILTMNIGSGLVEVHQELQVGGGAGSTGATITAAGVATFDGSVTIGDGTNPSPDLVFDGVTDMSFNPDNANSEIDVTGFMLGLGTSGPTPTGGFLLNGMSGGTYPTSSASAGHAGLFYADPAGFIYLYEDFGAGLEWRRASVTWNTF